MYSQHTSQHALPNLDLISVPADPECLGNVTLTDVWGVGEGQFLALERKDG